MAGEPSLLSRSTRTSPPTSNNSDSWYATQALADAAGDRTAANPTGSLYKDFTSGTPRGMGLHRQVKTAVSAARLTKAREVTENWGLDLQPD